MGTLKNTKPIPIRIRSIAALKAMMDDITTIECEIHPTATRIVQIAQIHKVQGIGITKQKIHTYRKFVRRREKTETTNQETSIPTAPGPLKIKGAEKAVIRNTGLIMTGAALRTSVKSERELHVLVIGQNTSAHQGRNTITIARQKFHSGKNLVSGLNERGVVRRQGNQIAATAVPADHLMINIPTREALH